MTTPEVRITLRMPGDLRDRVAAAADRDRRSMNAQILIYIEHGLDADQGEDQGG